MKNDSTDHSMKKQKNQAIPLFAIIIMLAVVFVAVYYIHESISQTANQRFSTIADIATEKIEDRLHQYAQVLRGGRGLFESTEYVSPKEWNSYVLAQKLQEQYPGIQGVGFSKYIGNKQFLDLHEEEFKQLFGQNYTVIPDSQRDEYTSIIYLEPQDKRNKVAIGYDMFSESVRRSAMSFARDNDTTSLSGKVTLVQEIDEDKQNGFLMYVPVYNNELPHTTILERQTNILGWIYEPFRANDFINGALSTSEKKFYDIKLYDDSRSESNLLFSTSNRTDHVVFTHLNNFEFGNRQWIVEFYPTDEFLATVDRTSEFLVLILGILSSFLMYFVIHSSIKKYDDFENLIVLSNEIIGNKLDMVIDDDILSKKGKLGNLARAINNIREKMIKIHLEEQQIMKSKDEFASMMSHELKSPLVPILGYCEMLSNPDMLGPLDSEKQSAVNEISKNATLLHTLILQMLDINKLELGKITIVKSEFQLSDFLNNILTKFYPLAVEYKIEMKIDYIDEGVVNTDKTKLDQIFSNIILNAVDFLPKQEATIIIGSKIQESNILFYIRDNGSGISKSDIDNIFQKFYQVDKTLARSHGGTGLGLSICNELITLLGGNIWVESTIGKGTTFYFTIPKYIEN